MLNSWRLNPDTKGPAPLRRVIDPETARPVLQQACNRCRTKKLKCSGERSGCGRCRTLSRQCIYHARNVDRKAASASQQRKAAGSLETETEPVQQNINLNQSLESLVSKFCPSPRPFPSLLPTFSSAELQHQQSNLGFPGVSDDQMVSFLPEFELTNDTRTVTKSPVNTELWVEPLPTSSSSSSSTPSSSSPSMGTSRAPESVDQPSVVSMSMLATPITQAGEELCRGWTPHTTPCSIMNTPYICPTQSSPDSCQCLQQIVMLMEEHDDRGAGTEALSLDAMLAVLKEAIHYSDALLTCCRCRTRPENMTILTFLTHRLAALCEKLVLKFCEGPPTSMRVQDYYLGDNNNDEPEQQQRTVQGQGSPTLSLSLGCYEMDSLVELDVLFRCLSHIQLRALSTLMDKLQRQASGLVNCESVRKKAAATKTQVLTLLQKLVAVPMAE